MKPMIFNITKGVEQISLSQLIIGSMINLSKKQENLQPLATACFFSPVPCRQNSSPASTAWDSG
jgi:hypothetical protein